MKFKNIKKKAKSEKSPSNSRIISSSVDRSEHSVKLFRLYRGALKAFVVFIFIVAVIIVGYDFQKNLQVKQDIDSQRKAIARDLDFWEDFISKHQNYRDAYLQASILEYKLGDINKAKKYARERLSLDPNSENGKKIEELLNK